MSEKDKPIGLIKEMPVPENAEEIKDVFCLDALPPEHGGDGWMHKARARKRFCVHGSNQTADA